MSSGEHPSESRPAAVDEQPSRAGKMAVAVLVVATIAAYCNTLTVPFVFDDQVDVVDNASIRQLWPIWEVFLHRTPNETYVRGRPVVNLSLALNYAVGGLQTLPYHLTNLAVHVLAGLTLLGIVRRTLSLPSLGGRYEGIATPLAFTIAAIWTLHPLQTQAVTYVIQRYESMMGLFYLLSLYCVLRSVSAPQPRQWTAAAVAACFLAMGSKEVAVSLPLVILLYDRAFLAGSFREAWRQRQGLYLGLLAAWLGLAALMVISGGRSQWSGFALPIAPQDYARTQFDVILYYLRLSFWPHPQVFDYAWPLAENWGQVLPAVAIVLGLLAATGYALFRWPRWGLFGAWFFLILAPTSSVMPIADNAVEHRMYLSLAAVVTVAVLAVHRLFVWLFGTLQASPLALRSTETAVAAVVLVALGATTFARNQVYQSEWTLWQDVVAKVPENARAHNNLGNTILKGNGDPKEAIAHYRKALELNPLFVNAHCNLAAALIDQGEMEEAKAECQKAIDLDSQCARAYGHLGNILLQEKRLDEAVVQYRKALRLDPLLVPIYNKLAGVLMTQGKVEEAMARYRKALEVNPNSADSHNNLANALIKQGKADEALAHYTEALALDPQLADAHYNLANILNRQDKLDEAVAHYRAALEITPRRAEAHNNLGVVLERQGSPGEAVEHYQEAVRLNPKYADAHGNLAMVFAKQGKLDEAIVQLQEAVEIQPGMAAARCQLAAFLMEKGRLDEAAAHLRTALQTAPTYVEARFLLGRIYSMQAKSQEAVKAWREVLRAQPNAVPVLHVLAWELATSSDSSVRNGTEAVGLAERARQLAGQPSAQLLDTLAAAYAETGKFPDAVRTARLALEQATTGNDTRHANALSARLKLYEAGAPYHAPAPSAAKPGK